MPAKCGKRVERELEGLVLFLAHWVAPPRHPHRVQTRINTDDRARLKVRWKEFISKMWAESRTIDRSPEASSIVFNA